MSVSCVDRPFSPPSPDTEAGRSIEAQYWNASVAVARLVARGGGGVLGFNREIARPWLAAGEQRNREPPRKAQLTLAFPRVQAK